MYTQPCQTCQGDVQKKKKNKHVFYLQECQDSFPRIAANMDNKW